MIDQFEEVFSLVDDEEDARRFLDAIVAAVADPRSRVGRVVVTLRADFYDRPLEYRGFGELCATDRRGRADVIEELERAVAGPAERGGRDDRAGA